MGAGASNTGSTLPQVSPGGIGNLTPTNTMGTPSTGGYTPPSMTAPTSLAPMQAMPQLPAQLLPAMGPQMVGQLLQSRVAPRYSELMAQMAAPGMPSAYRESAVYNGLPGEGLRTSRLGDSQDARGIKGGQGATGPQPLGPFSSPMIALMNRKAGR